MKTDRIRNCKSDVKKLKTTDAVDDKNVCNTGNTLFIEVKIGKRRCSALLDTGSEVTLLPIHLADLSQLHRSTRKLRGGTNGTIINILGEWCTKVTLGLLQVDMNFIVSDQIDEFVSRHRLDARQ